MVRDEIALKDTFQQYLLGTLSPSEQEQVESQYFAEAESLMELQQVCDDLVDDYLRGQLPAEIRKQLEQRSEQLPFLRTKITHDKALLRFIDAQARETSQVLAQDRPGFAGIFRAWFRFFKPLPQTITVLLLVGMVITAFWYVGRSRMVVPEGKISQTGISPSPSSTTSVPADSFPPSVPASSPSQKPIREDASPSPSRKKEAPVIASLLLSADSLVRGNQEAVALILPNSSGQVQLEIEVPGAKGQRFHVVLQTQAGQVVQEWMQLQGRKFNAMPLLTLRISAFKLPPAEYAVKVFENRNEQLPISQYSFRVEKK